MNSVDEFSTRYAQNAISEGFSERPHAIVGSAPQSVRRTTFCVSELSIDSAKSLRASHMESPSARAIETHPSIAATMPQKYNRKNRSIDLIALGENSADILGSCQRLQWVTHESMRRCRNRVRGRLGLGQSLIVCSVIVVAATSIRDTSSNTTPPQHQVGRATRSR